MSEKRLATILLVEDEASDADLICRGFAKAKVVNPIVHLRNGDDALAYLEGVGQYADRAKFPLPAFILLDLKLPGMKGLELLQWKRTRREVRRIPVVVLTSDRESATMDAAYDLGANSYLVKPGTRLRSSALWKQFSVTGLILTSRPSLLLVPRLNTRTQSQVGSFPDAGTGAHQTSRLPRPCRRAAAEKDLPNSNTLKMD